MSVISLAWLSLLWINPSPAQRGHVFLPYVAVESSNGSEGAISILGDDVGPLTPEPTVVRPIESVFGCLHVGRLDRNSDGSTDLTYQTRHDEHGRVTNRRAYLGETTTVVHEDSFRYDEHGQLVQVESDEDGDGSVERIDRRQYYLSGALARRELLTGAPMRVAELTDYRYMPDDLRIFRVSYDGDADGNYDTIDQYDYYSALTIHLTDFGADGTWDARSEFEYVGVRLTQERYFVPADADVPYRVVRREYDGRNLLARESEGRPGQEYDGHLVTTYEYNSRGWLWREASGSASITEQTTITEHDILGRIHRVLRVGLERSTLSNMYLCP